jgi:hypothetical protein
VAYSPFFIRALLELTSSPKRRLEIAVVMRVEGQPDDSSPSRQANPSAPDAADRLTDSEVMKEKHPRPSPSYTLTDRALQILIDRIAEEHKRSKVYSSLVYPLILVVVGSLGGTAITYIYTNRQQEITRRHSLLDGINNSRLPKLGDLWERLDADDIVINELLEETTDTAGKKVDRSAKVHQIVEILQNDRRIAARNRFWLGEFLFNKTDEYLDRTVQICLNSVTDPNADLTELRKKKDTARQDVIKLRDLFLEGDLNH